MTELTISLASLVAGAASFTVVATAYLKAQKIWEGFKTRREVAAAAIALKIKEGDKETKDDLKAQLELIEVEFSAKIDAIHLRIETLKEARDKDMEHLKEAYASEIRFLGSKVDEIKEEMRVQMATVVQLVSRLIDKA